jgi:branched-chain amino acid transport system permease protein
MIGRNLNPGVVAAVFGFLIFAFVFAQLFTNIAVLDFVVLASILGIAAIGYNFIIGCCGLFALGQAGLMCLGAYSAGYGASVLGFGPYLAACLAILVPVLATIFIGAPSLRLRGLYFGIATLVFSIFVVSVATAWTEVTGGPSGLSGIPSLGQGNVAKVDYFFWIPFAVVSLGFAAYISRLLIHSRIGDEWRAIARDEVLAANLGIDVFRSKMTAFVLSAALAGYAGFLFVYYVQFITPGVFGMKLTIILLLMVYLGGAGTVWGPLVGAILVQGLTSFLPSDTEWFEALYALIVLGVLTLLPQGIAGSLGSIVVRLRESVLSISGRPSARRIS